MLRFRTSITQKLCSELRTVQFNKNSLNALPIDPIFSKINNLQSNTCKLSSLNSASSIFISDGKYFWARLSVLKSSWREAA